MPATPALQIGARLAVFGNPSWLCRYNHLSDRRPRYIPNMSPTVLREGPFRLFFFSREEPRMHVHVSHPDGEAKFWLTPEVVLADAVGLTARQLAEAQDVVERHIREIRDA